MLRIAQAAGKTDTGDGAVAVRIPCLSSHKHNSEDHGLSLGGAASKMFQSILACRRCCGISEFCPQVQNHKTELLLTTNLWHMIGRLIVINACLQHLSTPLAKKQTTQSNRLTMRRFPITNSDKNCTVSSLSGIAHARRGPVLPRSDLHRKCRRYPRARPGGSQLRQNMDRLHCLLKKSRPILHERRVCSTLRF